MLVLRNLIWKSSLCFARCRSFPSVSSFTKTMSLKQEGKEEEMVISNLSKRAQKRLKNREHDRRRKDQKKAQRKSEAMSNNSDIVEDQSLVETNYYFQNGLRKVYPYNFTFSTFAKGRWYHRTLLDVFKDEFRYKSQEEIIFSIKKGKITVNGKNISPDYKIDHNDFIENSVHRHELSVTDNTIRILENTPELLVIDKPASIPIHPCGRYRHNSITYILAKEYQLKNLRPIYRLDRLTSGVLIFSKTEGKAHQMIQHIKNRQVEKEYVCKVDGEFPSGVIECKEPIAILSPKIGVRKIGKDGKESRTTFERISCNGTTSIVKCRPHTGRTHQIRVHLQYLGHPIINDPIYRGPCWGPLGGKGGQYGRPEEKVIEDLFALHNSEQFIESTEIIPEIPVVTDIHTNAEVPISDEHASKYVVNDKMVSNKVVHNDIDSTQNCSSDGSNILQGNAKSNKGFSDKNQTSSVESFSCCTVNNKVTANTNPDVDSADNVEIITSNTDSVSDSVSLQKSLNCKNVTLKRSNETDIEQLNKNEKVLKLDEVVKGENCIPNMLRAEFDKSLLSVDPDCEECKLHYKDPSPNELVMYLHAYRYKGPDWEFSTPMPHWVTDSAFSTDVKTDD